MLRSLIIFFLLGLWYPVQAQHLFSQLTVGINRTAFAENNYKPALAVPASIRIGGGSSRLQLGVEYQQYFRSPSYVFKDSFTENIRFTEKMQESLAGLFVRFNSSGSSETGFTLRAGAGYLFVTKTTVLADGQQYEEIKLAKTPAFNVASGVAIKLSDLLHLTVEGTYAFCNRNRADYAVLPSGSDQFSTSNYGLMVGLAAYIIE